MEDFEVFPLTEDADAAVGVRREDVRVGVFEGAICVVQVFSAVSVCLYRLSMLLMCRSERVGEDKGRDAEVVRKIKD